MNTNAAQLIPQELDTRDLEYKVKKMYQAVAENPDDDFHFEMGRAMAERLGYPVSVLDMIPAQAINSFAGVGYYFHFADLKVGESVVDLGSGSGMDTFFASLMVGKQGHVVGIDMTDAQRNKADALKQKNGFDNVSYLKGYIQATPCEDASFDAVISNGVFNLAPDKSQVFREAFRLLRAGGRLALADIVTSHQLPSGITCNAELWAACIGGAMQIDDYLEAAQAAGFVVEQVQDNPEYQFISDSAQGATQEYGVKSVSILARKPD